MSKLSKDRDAIRCRRAPALHPTARAIRTALALGLAMATAAPSFAGTCDVSDPSNGTCDGVFTGVGIAYAIDDLSLVVGGESATTIDPGAGVAGIDLYAANGGIELDSAADITTYGATGIRTRAFYGDLSVHNSGEIHASNFYGSATGIDARSYYGDIEVINDGLVAVEVTGYGNASGINASNFYADVTIVNGDFGVVSASTDNVYGGTATGIKAGSVLGASGVINYGDIEASAIADYGNATAYGVNNRGGYYGITSVVNEGEITAYASTDDGVGWAWGVRERGRDAQLSNSGLVSAEAHALTGYASATAAYVRGSYASTSNGATGELIAHAEVETSGQALAYGAMTWGYYSSSLDNQGNIEAHASTAQGTAVAMGTSSHYDHVSTVDNTGSILAEGYSGLGFVESVGVYNYALDLSTVYNADIGTITALASVGNGYAFAYGAWLDAGYLSTLDNDGLISANASVDDSGAFQDYGGMARSIGASVKARYGDAYLDNGSSGIIEASSDVQGDYGRAYAFGAVVQGGNIAHLSNAGSISAEAYSVAGYATALGDIAYGTFAVNLNYGSVSASAVVGGFGYAQAIGQYAFGEVATVVNEGSVSATAEAGFGGALATGAMLYGAWVGAYNYDEIHASAHAVAGYASAYGVVAFGVSGSSVENSLGALIAADASVIAGDASAQGINNEGYFYDAYVSNAGDVQASASTEYGNAVAVGVVNIAYYFGMSLTSNSGDIVAQASSDDYGSAEAVGVYNYAFVYGGVEILNTGTISASATGQGYASATGASAVFYDGAALIDNQDTISAVAVSLGGAYGGAEAIGVGVDTVFGKYNLPEVMLSNSGTISASASRYGDYGFASASGVSVMAMYAGLYNSGNIDARAYGEGYLSGAEATGALLFAKYGVATVNDDTIHAEATTSHGGNASAIGLLGTAYYADASLHNYGEISAEALADFDGSLAGRAYALGVLLHGGYSAQLYNAGSIAAHASADYGSAMARGFVGSGKYDVATLDNSGEIVAVADAYSGYATAQAARVSSKYGAFVSNEGSIDARAYAESGVASATGLFVQAPGAHGYIEVATGAALYNYGEIYALARAEGGQASAVGARVEGAQDAGARSYNFELIQAVAEGADAFATGLHTWSYYGEVSLANYGDIHAVAIADGEASAVGSITRAQGFGPPGYPAGGVDIYNAGSILASASAGAGGSASAFGVVAIAEQDLSIDNHGSIVAIASGGDAIATAVYMDTDGLATLVNSGDILAIGVGSAHIAVYSGANATAVIDNYGSIAGSILTGELDDTLVNHAGATLVLRNDLIDLGAYSASGNSFSNEGLIVVRGDGNGIAMGEGLYTLAPAPNPLAFVNDGVLDFHDGAADDVLTVSGDLAGHGELSMDANGLTGGGDLLYVDGSVVDDGVQTINVWFTGMPTTASTTIALAKVSGDSAAGDFVLGDVHDGLAASFLDVDFSFDANIDVSNAHADVFSLQVDVVGLSDAGTLAAAIAPAAQSLLSAQVGTWRQRMGQLAPASKGALGLWARLFRAKGAIAPEHEAANFGQGGNFGFEQRNSGIEAGIDFAVSEELSLGLLVAKSEANQRLRGPGSGGSKVEGDTVGVYGTWMSPGGLYLDGSWRRMNFDVELGALHTDGRADSFNIEAGYAWTLSGGARLEPQLQYTRTRIDQLDPLTLGATEFRAQAGASSRGRAGLMLSKRFEASEGGWSWAPYGVLSAVREFDGENGYAINGDFFGATSTRGSSVLVQGGVTATREQWQLSASLDWQHGGALQRFFGGQLNLSYRW